MIRRIFLIVAVAGIFCRCGDDTDGPYSNYQIVIDNAMAVSYFHTVFVETENIWAIVHENAYHEGMVVFDQTQGYKEINIEYSEEEDANTVTVEYLDWKSNNHLLRGTIIVTFDANSYRRHQESARVTMSNFFIEGQIIAGVGTLQYRNANRDESEEDEESEVEEENDTYFFNLLDGASIREQGRRGSSSVLITATIRNGNYERVFKGEALSPEDDVWKYWGSMTGILRERPTMRYTNTVVSSMSIDGQVHDVALYFLPGCNIAASGISTITIQGLDEIRYLNICEEVYYETLTHNFRH